MSTGSSQGAPQGYWGTYGWGGSFWQEPSATAKLKETCGAVQNVINDPETFFEGAVRGALKGVASQDVNGNQSSLFDKVTQIVGPGVTAVSVVALEKLLENAETYDLDEQDKELKKVALKALHDAKKAKKSVKETAQCVWDTINQYHIIMGGINLNVKPSSNQTMRQSREDIDGKTNDGVSPIQSLVRSQEEWRILRTKHNLSSGSTFTTPSSSATHPLQPQLTPEELEQIKELEEKTDELVHNFSHKITHFTTMHIIHSLFNHATDPSFYLMVIGQDGDIKNRYLKKLFGKGTFRYYFYKLVYSLILWFIRPIIEPTIQKVVAHLRTFLKSDIDLLNFIEQKIGDMKEYYGRIEKGRQDYLLPGRTDEAGSFDKYLEESIKIYDGKYTEADLIKIFNEYIVQNFVPRPTIAIRGYRIPLISSFIEWIIHSIRKAVVRRVLKKTKIVEKMLTQGSGSVHYAQLGLKRMLEKKLTQIVEMIDRARSKTAAKSDADYKMELAAKKAQIISRKLHLTIQQHSQKLLRFIDIESCNNDDRKLRNLDNPVSHLVSDAIRAIADIVKWEPFSIEKILETAATDVMETSLLSLFEGKETQIETQLQTIFGILDKSFAYIPEEKRADIEHEYRKECTQVDANLNTLQEQLARAAVDTALDTYLKNASGERHNEIKKYVDNEKEAEHKFKEQLASQSEKLQKITSPPFEYDENRARTSQLKAQMGILVITVENYLRHISMQLRSKELEGCYTDVRGDLHNIYAFVIATLNQLHQEVEKTTDTIDGIRSDEEELICAERCSTLLNNFSTEESFSDAKKTLSELYETSPKSQKSQIQPLIQKIATHYKNHEETKITLDSFDDYLQMSHFDEVEKQIDTLANLTRAYHDLGVNNKFRTKEAVEQEQKRLIAEIQKLYNEILSNGDQNIQNHILPLLKANHPDQLYQVFYSSFFRSHVPLFSLLAKIKLLYQKKLEIFTEELKKTNGSPPERKLLEEKQQTLRKEIENNIQQIRQILSKNTTEKTEKIQRNLEQITVSTKVGFDKAIFAFDHAYNEFGVKGCVSVGGLVLHQNLAPQLTARVAPEIIKGTRTLIDAMGKPFHSKQMILRLVLLDVVKRQEEAVSA